MTHNLDIRVYYHDTDAGGVVYHGAYLDFAERSRTEYLRAHGHNHKVLLKDENMVFVVRKTTIDYLLPGFIDDALVMETSAVSVKNSSFIMKQILKRGEDILAEMEFVLVCIDAQKLRPVKIPEALKVDLEKDIES